MSSSSRVNVSSTRYRPRGGRRGVGLFGTAQQFGGALGVAAAGTVFFAHVAGPRLTSAFTAVMPLAVGAYALCARLVLWLPDTAIMDADV